jgi:predicted phosphodiesterase
MGGITEDLVAVNKTFEIIESQNIDTIFHLGDLVDGPINYSTRQTLKVVGAKEQGDYFVSHYPFIPGTTTYCVRGNHDKAHNNFDVVKYIASQRNDILVSDDDTFHISVGDMNILARHLFYKEEIDEINKNSNIDMIVHGHYHIFKTLCYSNTILSIAGELSNDGIYTRNIGFLTLNIDESNIEINQHRIYENQVDTIMVKRKARPN